MWRYRGVIKYYITPIRDPSYIDGMTRMYDAHMEETGSIHVDIGEHKDGHRLQFFLRPEAYDYTNSFGEVLGIEEVCSLCGESGVLGCT